MFVELFTDWSFWQIHASVTMALIAWYTLTAGGLWLLMYSPYSDKRLSTNYLTRQPKASDETPQQVGVTSVTDSTQLLMSVPEDLTVRASKTLQSAYSQYYDGVISCLASAINISLPCYLSLHGYGQLYYSATDMSLLQHLLSAVVVILVTEVFEFGYHYLSHHNRYLMKFHMRHHKYHHPTPLTVLSDDPVDAWVKSSPLLWLPLLLPIYDGVIFLWYTLVIYIYGIYIHCGVDIPLIDPHSKVFISSWHHNSHHRNKPNSNFGFYTRWLDYLCGTAYDG